MFSPAGAPSGRSVFDTRRGNMKKPTLEWLFVVALNGRVVCEGGAAHIYTTWLQAENVAAMIKDRVGLRNRGYVDVLEINVNKLNSILE